jgi:hypothetical protein
LADDRAWASTLDGLRRRIAADGARLRAAGGELPDIEPRGMSAQLGPHLLALLEHEVAHAHGAAHPSRRRGLAARVLAVLFGITRDEANDLVAAGRTSAGVRRFAETATSEIAAAIERLEVRVARIERTVGELREAERARGARALEDSDRA